MRISIPRLELREFELNDWLDVFNYHSEPLYARFYPQSECTDVEARKFVRMFLDQQTDIPRRRFQLAITLGGGGRLIGNCGIRRKPDNDWEADIGYELAPDFWGRGYATEAALAMVDSGFVSWDFIASRLGA